MSIVWIDSKKLQRLKRRSNAARVGWMLIGAVLAVGILAASVANDRIEPVQVNAAIRRGV